MDICGNRRGKNTASLLFLLVILSPHQIFPTVNGNESETGNKEVIPDTKSSVAKALRDTLSMLKKSHKSSWDKITAIIRQVQLLFFPPNLDFRGADEVNGMRGNGKDGGASQKMKKAAEKSFKTTRETAEKTAESAAIAVEQAAHATAQTMKRKQSIDHDDDTKRHDEL